ncbi:MAG: nitrous oxide reductase accessory protein NosL [Ignavibacteriales bacterium]|nr:nitrous oxide reductase accessory protein NosL [Ignavibacteriales bacterium]
MFKNNFIVKIFLILIASFVAVSCQSNPEPIAYGEDSCDNCRMTISDPKYGAELISDKGKIFKFDSIECLAAYSMIIDQKTIASMWATDFSNKENFINTDDALFLRSENLRSPMGLNLSAYQNLNSLYKVKNEFGGTNLRWEEILNYVKSEWK